jgi:hypothetical protein
VLFPRHRAARSGEIGESCFHDGKVETWSRCLFYVSFPVKGSFSVLYFLFLSF